MSFRIGDPLYNPQGMPGVVTEKDQKTQKYKADTDAKVVLDEFRHGYIKGLDLEKREEFNSFLDEVRSLDNVQDQMIALKEKIESIETDQDPEKRKLATYLKAELSHTMTSNNIHPRYYQIPFNRTT